MKLLGLTLLLSFLVVAQAPEGTDATRTIDVRLSRYAFSPERIEVRLGERVSLNIISVDGPHGL
jgi:hypothetical protein